MRRDSLCIRAEDIYNNLVHARAARRKPIIPRFTTNATRKQRSLTFQAVPAIERTGEMGDLAIGPSNYR